MLHPILLTGAALAALPIVLHLIMRQEPKRLRFPAYRFLKEKSRTNERKMRLKHLLLLLVRIILILLIALALFQPTILSEGLNLSGDQPVVATLIIDTSPSMGYVVADRSGLNEARQQGLKLLEESIDGPWTLLDDARFRAMELLEQLPIGSKIAIIDSSERTEPVFANSVDEAKKRIIGMKKPIAANQPITRVLDSALRALSLEDEDRDQGEKAAPRILAIFSDETISSWDEKRIEDLKTLRDKLINRETKPLPLISLYLDVGIERPQNVAITQIEMKPQLVSVGQPAVVQVTVIGDGFKGDQALICKLDSQPEPIKKPITIPEEGSVITEFRFENLQPGLHQIEISLAVPDSLPFDNTRSFTFRVREPRKTLAIMEEPSDAFGLFGGSVGQRMMGIRKAGLWRLALLLKGWYDCEIVSAKDVLGWKPETWSQYEAITLAGLDEPSDALWLALNDYVEKQGGQLIILPGDKMDSGFYKTPLAKKVLPGTFEKRIDLDPMADGTTWNWDELNANHPLLAPFAVWRQDPNIDFVRDPPRTWRYWQVEPEKAGFVVIRYANDADAKNQHPAILEKQLGGRGKVLVLTTAWDARRDEQTNPWNDYLAGKSFFFVTTNEIIRYLIGDVEDANFNFPTGQPVVIKWPMSDTNAAQAYYLNGPDIIGTDGILKRDPKQGFFRLVPEQLKSAGSYQVEPEDRKWQEGFSLNTPSEESNLDRLNRETIEAFLGKDTVIGVDRNVQLQDSLKGTFAAPLELFPFLMIALLLFMAFENVASNRFYRSSRK
jgi:hypothetical protein